MAKAPTPAVFSHWHRLLENLQFSPMEFYQTLETAIQRRDVPGAERSRVEWYEGGAFSAKRQYLRVTRGKHVFDICAAPFGRGFFVSWWLGEVRSSLALAIMCAVVGTLIMTPVFMEVFGFLRGLFFLFVVIPAIFGLLTQLAIPDDRIVEWPVIGPIYDWLFRPNTYYKTDTALMYQDTVHAAVLEVIDQITYSKGIRALSELERKPILKGFVGK
jgi:hypothetical protein